MKQPLQKRRAIASATLAPTLWLVGICSTLFMAVGYAADPSWWSTPGTAAPPAVLAPQLVTNNGVVTTNYAPNPNALVTQGQLKRFTARAVDEMNAKLPAGAGTTLNNLVSGWAQDYATNNYNTTNNPAAPYKPSDLNAMTIGQLKYIGNAVWSQLVINNYTNAAPSWLAANPTVDHNLAVIGQLKSIFNFDLNSVVLRVTSPLAVQAPVGVPFSYAPTASGLNSGPFSVSGTLPPGLSFNGGILAGTPTTTGSYSVTLMVGTAPRQVSTVLVITVVDNPNLPVITGNLAEASAVNSTFTYQITATNSPSTYGASGLPPGLSINSTTGVISGTPAIPGIYTITLSATSGTSTDTAAFTLIVSGANSPSGGTSLAASITSAQAVSAQVGQAFQYGITVANSGGGVVSYSASNLPPGLSQPSSSGIINGTPTQAGIFPVILTANSANGTATAIVDITVSPTELSFTNPGVVTAYYSVPFSLNVTTTSPTATITAAGLPSWLHLDSTSDILYGTPDTSFGQQTVTLTATDGTASATQQVSINVEAVQPGWPAVPQGDTVSATVGQPFSYALPTANNPLSFTASPLPAGLSLDPATGVISGTPTEAGTFDVSLSATNDEGTSYGDVTITVSFGAGGAPALLSPALVHAVIAQPFQYTAEANNNPSGFSASSLPAWLHFDGHALSGTPTSSGTTTVELSWSGVGGSASAPLAVVVGTSTVTQTAILQDGNLPTPQYQTASSTIAQDPNNPVVSAESSGGLLVGSFANTTQINRGLIEFDLSSLPSDAVITGVYLRLTPSDYNVASPVELDLYKATPFKGDATWDTNGNPVGSSILSEVANSSTGTNTWASSSQFVAAAQAAFVDGEPLCLMVAAPSLESAALPSTNDQFINFQSDASQGIASAPELVVNYVTSAAPPIIPQTTIVAGLGISLPDYQVTNFGGGVTFSGSELGLTISSTGVITGTATGSGTFTFTATNGNGSTSESVVINAGAPATLPTTVTATPGQVGAAYTFTLPSQNATLFTSDNLPQGLSIDPGTGTISGTPQTAGTDTFTVSASNYYGSAQTQVTLVVAPEPLTITSLPSPVTFYVGSYMNYYSNDAAQFSRTPDTATLTIAGATNNLGLTMNTNGAYQGVPNAVGNYTGTVTVTETSTPAGSAQAPVQITVLPLPETDFTAVCGAASSYGWTEDLYYSHGVYLAYPVTNFTFTSGNVPSWLSVDSAGDLSGTPTGGATTTTLSYSAQVSGVPVTGQIKLTVYASNPLLTGSSDATATAGTFFDYSGQLLDTATYVTSVEALSPLPTGVYLNYFSGFRGFDLEGTPTTPGTYPINLLLTDFNGSSNEVTVTLTVAPNPGPCVALQQAVSPDVFYTVPSAVIAEDAHDPTVAGETVPSGTVLPIGVSPSPFNSADVVNSRALLAFDLSALPPDAQITSATLFVFPVDDSHASNLTLQAYAVSGFDAANATWTADSGHNPTTLASSGGVSENSSNAGWISLSSSDYGQSLQSTISNLITTASPVLYLTVAAPSAEGGTTNYVELANNTANAAENPVLFVTYTEPGASGVPVISSASVYHGIVGQPVNYVIRANNDATLFSASNLPSGLSCSASGAITGTVATVGSTVATVTASNGTYTPASLGVTFNIDSAVPATMLSKPTTGSGDGQEGLPGSTLSQPLVALASTASGALANTLVTFTVPNGAGALAGSGSITPYASTVTVATDGNGLARAWLKLPVGTMTFNVTASSGEAAPITFSETSSIIPANVSDLIELTVAGGDGQTAPAGSTLPRPLVVQAINAQGKPSGSVPLSFSVSPANAATITPSSVVTDSHGMASFSLSLSSNDSTGTAVKVQVSAANASPVYLTATAGQPGSPTTPNPSGGSAPTVDADWPPESTVTSYPPQAMIVDGGSDGNGGEYETVTEGDLPEPLYLVSERGTVNDEWWVTQYTDNVSVESVGPGTYDLVASGEEQIWDPYVFPPEYPGTPGGVWDIYTPSDSLQFGPYLNATDDGQGGGTMAMGGSFIAPVQPPPGPWNISIDGEMYITMDDPDDNFIVTSSLGGTVSGGFTWKSDGTNQGAVLTVTPKPGAPVGATLTVVCKEIEGGAEAYAGTATFTVPSPSFDLQVSTDEASGPRYRKIALNGLPMPDEKPQQSQETDQEKEETYVDALTDQMHHSTTDIYLPVSGSDLTVSARRDFRSQVWSWRNGLRPHERPDLPFGICWSSNLAPCIDIQTTTDPVKTAPDLAYVTDETGAQHTFVIWYDSTGAMKFFPMPTAKNEQQVPNLEALSVNSGTYTFTRKYGTTLTFQSTGLQLTTREDRSVKGQEYVRSTHTYARLIQAQDRLGNTINYQFASGSAHATDLIPEKITVANQPDLSLSIQQTPLSALPGLHSNGTQSVVTAIWDADGNETTFQYGLVPMPQAGPPGVETNEIGLTQVTAPDGSVTKYSYDAYSEPDQMPHAADDPGNNYWYVDLKTITDPLGNAYGFTYKPDHTKYNYMDVSSVAEGYYVQSGVPRDLTQVLLPDGKTTAVFDNSASNVRVARGTGNPVLDPSSVRQLIVKDAVGFVRTYRFDASAAVVNLVPRIPGPSGYNSTFTQIIAFPKMEIDYGTGGSAIGKETFTFNPQAAMALSSVTDLSGNTTTYTQSDAWTAQGADYQAFINITGAAATGTYDDPTVETNALDGINGVNGKKHFTYDAGTPANAPHYRIMTDVVDENGNHTHYDIDGLGRRTSEKIYNSDGTLVQETDFVYGSATYPGFMTQKTVKALGGSDPGWVKDLVTQYVPDTNGRVAEEIVDPSGLGLVTQYTYDANGNKLSTSDPRGNTTWFAYDSRNRLVDVTYADGSQKEMSYDARGNKIADTDENGHATLYQYDPFNRVTKETRDMYGYGADLVTSYQYNAVNSKIQVTRPQGGVTVMQYDNLQRLILSVDALGHSTQYAYGANSGGNGFDSSTFKPTQITDPRGYVTTITYDALYRAKQKAVAYDLGGDTSVTKTAYDDDGNPVAVTDPHNRVTQTAYDALNRPVLVTYADSSTASTSYTSTGLKWKTVDQNGNATQMQYDGAARLSETLQPAVANGPGGAATSPIQQFFYDASGNLIEKINPRGFTWYDIYDARDRKVQEVAPPVVDATTHGGASPTTTWQYDPAGNTIAVTDARGNETDTVYDPANRATDVNQPAVTLNGSTARPNTHTTYDLDGNVLTVTDPNGHTTRNAYDLLDRLTTTTDAAGYTVTNGYDAVGNKISVKDGNGNITGFAYDGLNRLTTTTDAAGAATTFIYDGLVKTGRTDALGQSTTYGYDVRERLQTVTYQNTSAPANSARTYAYDYDGNLLSVTEAAQPAANVAYAYDALNRVVSETSNGLTHTYAYDLAGNRLQTVYGAPGVANPTPATGARTLTSAYDALNRLATLEEQTAPEFGANETGRTTSYGYDLDGNIVAKAIARTTNGVVCSDTEAYAYDALNRCQTEASASVVNGGAPAPLFTYAYGYDLAGNVLTVGEQYPSGLNNRTTTNTYDTINRLTQEQAVATTGPTTTTNYTYDAANNRLTKTVATQPYGSNVLTTVLTNYSYNALNQLTGYNDTTGTRAVALAYDADGNRISRTISGGPDNGTDSYTYDFENRLIGLTNGTGGTAGGAGTYAYQYDYRTRRVVRNESGAGGATTAIVFSGGTSVQEYDNGAGTPTVEYVRGSDYGGGVGGILYTLRGGIESYTHENRRGDVIAKTDSTGSLTYQAQYEGFGKQVATNGSTLDRQKSNSKDTDPTGLVNEGFRYRDLETGMFITRDPAGFVDGPNLYTYVVQNPWTKFDPEGLSDEEVVGSTEDDIDETGAGLRDNDPERDAEGKPIFGSEEYEKENPAPKEEQSGSKPNYTPIVLPGEEMQWGQRLEPIKEDEIGSEVAKESEAEKDNSGATVDPAKNAINRERTPEENKQARDYFKNNKQAAREAWEKKTGQKWPTDANGNPWPAEHDPSLKSGGDPMQVYPRDPSGTDPHSIVGPDGKTDYERWGEMGTPAREANKPATKPTTTPTAPQTDNSTASPTESQRQTQAQTQSQTQTQTQAQTSKTSSSP